MSNDPLQLKGLAVNFDYLMYKISDRISTLSDQTHAAVLSKANAVENDYLAEQLQIETVLAEIETCHKDCRELEGLFAKLDQLYTFVDEFNDRLTVLEAGFGTATNNNR
ncbi:hypothetical protein PUMCH_002417 [Australozyma saopauloensis]|uniref:Biogenesis of lysosome-related organelles complex 1 subunit CNL1 n=1 Tax=Australozyma saopauloensis TaxID=291208 RepID=A0AAX4H9H3_9ASCO|nr:hypothetical protein PUMCH_002417 [[Candida] saopauloensis]